jgi:uncharacterized protein (DUF305 family)
MTNRQIFRALMIVSALAGPAAAQAMQGMPGMSAPAANGAASKPMMDGMAKMNEAMAKAPMTGDPDRDFVAMMIPHHAGAIDMAKVELQYGKDPAIRKLAKEIVAAQEREIAHMKAWQKTKH